MNEPIDLSKYAIDFAALPFVPIGLGGGDTFEERTFVSGLSDTFGSVSGFGNEADLGALDESPVKLVTDAGRRWWQILRRRICYFGDIRINSMDTTTLDDGSAGWSADFEGVGPLRKVKAWTKRGIDRKIRNAIE